MTYPEIRQTVVDKVLPIAEQAVMFAKFGAALTATKVDDQLADKLDAGTKLMRIIFTNPQIQAEVERLIATDKQVMAALASENIVA